MAAGQGAQEHGTGREIYSTCELLVRLAAAAFDRVAEKYAFQGGHRSPSLTPFWMEEAKKPLSVRSGNGDTCGGD